MTPASAAGTAQRAAPQRRSGAREHGVTLLELLVVLSIMGIVAALVIPSFGSGPSTTELKSAARQMAAALRLARSEALATRREHFVLLDLERRVFRVDNDAREIALPRDTDLKLYTAQSDLVSDKAGSIRFFPDGGSNGGRVTIAAGERKYEVDVDWLTGRVAILD